MAARRTGARARDEVDVQVGRPVYLRLARYFVRRAFVFLGVRADFFRQLVRFVGFRRRVGDGEDHEIVGRSVDNVSLRRLFGPVQYLWEKADVRVVCVDLMVAFGVFLCR